MSRDTKITVRIGALRVQGMAHAEAQVLGAALRESLAAHLAANPGALQGNERLQLRLSAGAAGAQGRALGVQIGSALQSPSAIKRGGS